MAGNLSWLDVAVSGSTACPAGRGDGHDCVSLQPGYACFDKPGDLDKHSERMAKLRQEIAHALYGHYFGNSA
jgi:hypothetical protein